MGSAYIDGCLEGHETDGVKFMYRAAVIIFILLSLFAGVCNIACIGHEGSHTSSLLNSVAILGLMGLSLQYVAWFQLDNMDPKFKKATAALMFLIVILDIGACMEFNQTMNYKPPLPAPTPSPTPTPTPTHTQPTFPPVTPNASMGFDLEDGNGRSEEKPQWQAPPPKVRKIRINE